jgi:hypothetical protein
MITLLVARRPPRKKIRKPRRPGDYEAELVRLCKGNRARAEALIADECKKTPGTSRQGAALAIVTRLRHGESPVKDVL